MQVNRNTYLKFVPYKLFELWDTKRYTSNSIVSKFNIVKLGNYIVEENKKYKLFNEPEKEFGILGVNNIDGIFDAYKQKGEEINQAYKKMEHGWLAYNPYRINVGSIGIKKQEHKNKFISPAYVVFSCEEELLPEFLFLVFKTDTFNKIINESTTGSVRQNLTINTLKSLQIPLPTLAEQEEIVNKYYSKIAQAEQLQKDAENLEEDIENYLSEALGIEKEKKEILQSTFRIVEYKKLNRWDAKSNEGLTSNYRVGKIGDYIERIATGTTPPTKIIEYFNGDINFYTPADLGETMLLNSASRKVSELAIKDNKARVFNKGDILFVGIGSTVGKVGIVNNEYASSNQQITGFSLNKTILNNEYVYYYFNYFKNITTKEKTKATLPIVNQGKIVNIPIPIPSLSKQIEITTHIKKIKKELNNKINRSEELILQAEQEFEQTIFNQ